MRTPLYRLVSAGSLCIVACSGNSSTDPEPNTPVTYEGVFSAGTESGRITLVTGTPATGSLKITGGPTVSVSGTYTPSTSAFAVTGGGYTVNATVNASAEVAGTITSAAAPVGGMMTAFASTSATQAMVFCGSFSSTYPPSPPKVAETGPMNITINGGVLRGLARQDTGEGAGPNNAVLAGTSNGSTLQFTYHAGYGSGSGYFDTFSRILGTWSNIDGISGVWTATLC